MKETLQTLIENLISKAMEFTLRRKIPQMNSSKLWAWIGREFEQKRKYQRTITERRSGQTYITRTVAQKQKQEEENAIFQRIPIHRTWKTKNVNRWRSSNSIQETSKDQWDKNRKSKGENRSHLRKIEWRERKIHTGNFIYPAWNNANGNEKYQSNLTRKRNQNTDRWGLEYLLQ